MAIPISLTFQLLLFVVTISIGITGDLLPWDSVCSQLCETPVPTTDVYLTNGQKKHLQECQTFIMALEETPEMLEVYSELQGMELVQFTGEQIKQLITGYNGYFRNISELPHVDTDQDLQLELPAYDNETLQNIQEDFLEKWNAYNELEQSLQGIYIHLDDSSSAEEEIKSSKKKKTKKTKKTKKKTKKMSSSEKILSRKKRLGKSYQPSQHLRELIRERISLGLDLSLRSPGVFNPKPHTSIKRKGLPKMEINDSVGQGEEFFESFRDRLMSRYKEAIERSQSKIRNGIRVRVTENSIRQKRDTAKEDILEVCPTVKFWTAMVLGYQENGNLVQVTQFPEYGQEQWFQEEKCLYILSPVQGNVECKVRFREVPAMVVDLIDPDGPIQESYIKVESCAAYLATGDTPPDSGTTLEPAVEPTTTL